MMGLCRDLHHKHPCWVVCCPVILALGSYPLSNFLFHIRGYNLKKHIIFPLVIFKFITSISVTIMFIFNIVSIIKIPVFAFLFSIFIPSFYSSFNCRKPIFFFFFAMELSCKISKRFIGNIYF